MKNLMVLLVCICFSLVLHAQQDIQYTQFMFNKLHFNPAYAGSKGYTSLSVIYKKQWIGIDRAPETGTFNAHTSLLKRHLGLGLSVSYDRIGFSERVSIETNYSYIIRFKNRSFLSLGLRGSFFHQQYNWNEADIIDEDDMSIPNTTATRMYPNFGAGIYFQAKRWYAGFSVPHIFVNKGDFNIQYNGSVEADFTQHYYLMSGFIFKASKEVKVHQSILMKYVVDAPLAMDFNVSCVLYDKVMIGVTYRINESIDVLLQWQITPRIRISAAYDIAITQLQKYNGGSVEAMLTYDFVPKDYNPDREVYNHRFF